MKKSYDIEKKLYKMADDIMPPDHLLDGARSTLAKQGKSSRQFPMRFRAIAAVAAVVIIAVVAVLIYNSLDSSMPSPPSDKDANHMPSYSLADLDVSLDELREDFSFDFEESLSNIAAKHYIYTDSSDKVVVYTANIKSVTAIGVDEITFVVDIGGGLKDYQQYKNGFQVYTKDDGQQVYYTENYQNGEWYTYAYYNKDDIDYYLTIMSPNQNMGEYYFQIF